MDKESRSKNMSNLAVVGINWGDEGKGRMVDLFTDHYDVVVRYQGGGNAGHTVVNEKGKFALHLLPSGVFRKGVMNVLGNGVALDLENLCAEIEDLRSRGVDISPDNLRISERASILFPCHRDLDGLEEDRLAGLKYGSTKQGIAPFYSDKYRKKTVMAGDLFYPEALELHAREVLDWENLILKNVYGQEEISFDVFMGYLKKYGEALKPYICDTSALLSEAAEKGKNIMFEAQLGALRDLDMGIYPYTTSSNTLAAYAPIGAGVPGLKVDKVVGIVKAYSSCVGEGPFVSEWLGANGDALREAGAEYGAKTGRARRVGAFDAVATRYGIKMQGATSIALTKLDILSYMHSIPVCTRYSIDGKLTDDFPYPAALENAKPVYESLPGWRCDISAARTWEDLPENARRYVEYIEKSVGCRVEYISVGARREEYIHKEI